MGYGVHGCAALAVEEVPWWYIFAQFPHWRWCSTRCGQWRCARFPATGAVLEGQLAKLAASGQADGGGRWAVVGTGCPMSRPTRVSYLPVPITMAVAQNPIPNPNLNISGSSRRRRL